MRKFEYVVEIYNFIEKKWDIMEFTDYPNDGKKKDAIFATKFEAEYLEGIANAITYAIKTRIAVRKIISKGKGGIICIIKNLAKHLKKVDRLRRMLNLRSN